MGLSFLLSHEVPIFGILDRPMIADNAPLAWDNNGWYGLTGRYMGVVK